MQRARKTKGRPSCLSSCFSGASVWDSDELDPPPFESLESFVPHLRSQRRTVPMPEIAGDGGEERLSLSGEITREDASSEFSPTQIDRKEERRSKITAQPQHRRCHVSACKPPNQASAPFQPVQTGFQPSRLARPARQPTPAPRHLGAAAGLAMMVATFAVMLLFGRLYAVLCNCVLFYFLSRLKQPLLLLPETKTNGAEVDLDSPEYKKKVVLTGLLERNRHRVSENPSSPMASPARRRGS